MLNRTRDQHLFDSGPKRILALDGGGIRGMLTLQILHKIETIIQNRLGDSSACLADYFDLIGGTSTGSIIAAGLALGWPVQKLITLYRSLGGEVFQSEWLRAGLFRPKFSIQPLRQILEQEFGDIRLGDDKIRTGLAIVTKRLDTGSPWVIFNNPKSRYFEARPNSTAIPNKNYLLRQVIRASTAAPHFFEPEEIEIADNLKGAFVDGGVSPHNNPALQMLLLATLEGYNIRWPMGVEKLMLVSVGTGFKTIQTSTQAVLGMKPIELALRSLQSLMDDASHLNELILQWMSTSPTARQLDREVGDLTDGALGGQHPWLTYLRYDAGLDRTWLQDKLNLDFSQADVDRLFAMDNPHLLDDFEKIGQAVAHRLVDSSHLSPAFDL